MNKKAKKTHEIKQIVLAIFACILWLLWLWTVFVSPRVETSIALDWEYTMLGVIQHAIDDYTIYFTCADTDSRSHEYDVDLLTKLCVITQDQVSWYERIEKYNQYPISQAEFLALRRRYEHALWTLLPEEERVESVTWSRLDDTAIVMYQSLWTNVEYRPYAPMSDAVAHERMKRRFQTYNPIDAEDWIVTRTEFLWSLVTWLPEHIHTAYAFWTNKDILIGLLESATASWTIEETLIAKARIVAQSLATLLTTQNPQQIFETTWRYAQSLERMVMVLARHGE